MDIITGLNPLPISEKLEANKGIYIGQDFHVFIKDLPDYLFTGYSFMAKLFKADDETVNFPLSAVVVSDQKTISLLISNLITETFIMGDHYLLRVDALNDSTDETTRIYNACCVCYR